MAKEKIRTNISLDVDVKKYIQYMADLLGISMSSYLTNLVNYERFPNSNESMVYQYEMRELWEKEQKEKEEKQS